MLCLFEDHLASNFDPIAATRHISHLLVGTMTLRERAVKAAGLDGVTLHGRGYIRDYYRPFGELVDPPDRDTLFINARLPLTAAVVDSFPKGEEWIVTWRGDVAAARLSVSSIERLNWEADTLDFPLHGSIAVSELEVGGMYEYIWDLLYANADRIGEEAAPSPLERGGTLMTGAHLLYEAAISIGRGTVVAPGVVLDASAGPIVLGSGVEIMANSVVVGPCFIGDSSRIKIGAKIYEKTSIGAWCKVGGEVENSIILGYSNKQHDGFLGHSYLGRWVNLGADTNTSDLKNNYGTVRVTLNGREINSGKTFIGSLIGDHAKTGINTMLNTGTVIGTAANVFGGGFPPKSIPSFAWGSEGEKYDLEKAIDVARRVMARRNVEFTGADEALLRRLYIS